MCNIQEIWLSLYKTIAGNLVENYIKKNTSNLVENYNKRY